MEVRCQIIHSLSLALSVKSSRYVLDQPVTDPDPRVLNLNADLVAYDETVVRFLRDKEINFIHKGLGLLIDTFMVTNAGMVEAMNANGSGRMQLNILVLQQNLKNIEADVNLDRAAKYYDIFDQGPEAVVKQAEEQKAQGNGEKEQFSYDDLKTLIELYYSEQLASPERGISTAARRAMGEYTLQLSELMWQT
jgi:exocyst complex component 4